MFAICNHFRYTDIQLRLACIYLEELDCEDIGNILERTKFFSIHFVLIGTKQEYFTISPNLLRWSSCYFSIYFMNR